MTADERAATLEAELGADGVLDPLAPSPRSCLTQRSCLSPGPQTPPQFADANVDIPPIDLPGSSPITNADNQLLGAVSESPMETTSASTSAVSTPTFSRAPGSAVSSTRGTPMSGTSPAAGSPLPGLGQGVCLYLHQNKLLPQTPFADAQRRLLQQHTQEETEDPIPKDDIPDWM